MSAQVVNFDWVRSMNAPWSWKIQARAQYALRIATGLAALAYSVGSTKSRRRNEGREEAGKVRYKAPSSTNAAIAVGRQAGPAPVSPGGFAEDGIVASSSDPVTRSSPYLSERVAAPSGPFCQFSGITWSGSSISPA